MLKTENSASKVAEFLLKIKAIKLQPENPFQWASGWNSPIYCDNRKTLSYPEIRNYIRDCFSKEINENYSKPDIIAGVATGGIALGALVAQELEPRASCNRRPFHESNELGEVFLAFVVPFQPFFGACL